MPYPLWDPAVLPLEHALPQGHALVDAASLVDKELQERVQARALSAWLEESGQTFESFTEREWDANEGIFVVHDAQGVAVGIALVMDV